MKVVQFAHIILLFGCWHMGEKNWHDRAYVNPFLILEANLASMARTKDFFPFHVCNSNYEIWA
jgi:hypothetical protein